jgi:hypothetical protein
MFDHFDACTAIELAFKVANEAHTIIWVLCAEGRRWRERLNPPKGIGNLRQEFRRRVQ